MVRRTKIMVTIGPSSEKIDVLEKMILGGINIVRLNFSHGNYETRKEIIKNVRKLSEKYDKDIAIVADLQGPKIRISSFEGAGKISLVKGQSFILNADLGKNKGTSFQVGIDYKELPSDVSSGNVLLLDDGQVGLGVERVEGNKIYCKVLFGEELSDNKGINKKGGGLNAKALTKKDIEDLVFAIEQKVDYCAISFPKDKEDIIEARELIRKFNGDVKIIAKIERKEAIENIDEIIGVSDALMIARGDLAIEVGNERVPVNQKIITRKSIDNNKPVITATQMMESMIHSKVPTRAEVSDIANAVFDHSDVVMFSAETATGRYPVEVIETAARVCEVSEIPSSYIYYNDKNGRDLCTSSEEAISRAATYLTHNIPVVAIISLTETGRTPLLISRMNTIVPIYGISRFRKTLRVMALYGGVHPIYFDATRYSYVDVDSAVVAELVKRNKIRGGEGVVIITKGDYIGVPGGTNSMKLVDVADVS